jgi:DNA-binding XRE family transcriptional regulator
MAWFPAFPFLWGTLSYRRDYAVKPWPKVHFGLFQLRLYYRVPLSSRGRMEKSVHTPEYAAFLRLLRETRETANVTQVELGRRLGQTQSFVSKCERGEIRLDVIQLRAICGLLDTDLSTFIRKLEASLAKRRKR